MGKETFSLLCIPPKGAMKQVIRKFPFPVALSLGKYRNIAAVFHKGGVKVFHSGVDVSTFSFVWISSGWDSRDLAYALRLYLESTKTPHSYAEKSSSKVTDCMLFTFNDLPIPDTVFISRANVERNMPMINEVCGYPLIIKDARGSRGKYSAYVDSEAELLKKMSTLPKSRKYFFQRFIPNEYDWGIMVANGVVMAGEKSYPAEGEYRNNACNGAQEVFVAVADIPHKLKEMAVKACGCLGLSWSRADIIIDKRTGFPYLLEVNRTPGLTSGSDEVSGAYTFLASQISHPLPPAG